MDNRSENGQQFAWLRHEQDPHTFRKDGKRRTGVGKFIHKAAPVVGRILKGTALGVVDGIPGLSTVVNTALAEKKVNNFAPAARVLSGWATTAAIGMTFAMKLTGHMDADTTLSIVLALIGL